MLVKVLICSLALLSLAIGISGDEIKLGSKFVISYIREDAALTVRQLSSPAQKLPVWATYGKHPFLRLGNASLPRPPILDGNYQLQEKVTYLSDITTIDTVQPGKDEISILVTGRLLKSVEHVVLDTVIVANYEMTFSLSAAAELQFTINVTPNPAIFTTSDGRNTLTNPRTFITYACEKDEDFYGFGESFSFFNLKGRNVPILVSEQGVGRGEQPITDTLNTDVAQGVGGGWYTTYAPKPIYITNHNRTVMLNNSEVSFFNLTHTDGSGELSHSVDA